MNITNLKCHARLDGGSLTLYRRKLSASEAVAKRTHSFAVLRLPPLVCTCFYSGFINITGIRTFEQARPALDSLLKHLCLEPEAVLDEPHIDSISSSWPKHLPLPAHKLNKVLDIAAKQPQVQRIKWNRQQFPALFLKTKFGTILWFNSPAIVSVGSKTKADLIELKGIVDRILMKLQSAS